MNKQIIAECPICHSNRVSIRGIACSTCDSRIETEIPVPVFFRLPRDLQEFVLVFLECRGSIRDTEKRLGISYPTVCKRLDQVNSILQGKVVETRSPRQTTSRTRVLEQLERGEISAAEAAKKLREQ